MSNSSNGGKANPPGETPGGARVRLFDMQQTLGADQCAVDAERQYNTEAFKYQIRNLRGLDRDTLLDFSADHVNLRFKDGYVAPPDAIDTDTSVRIGKEWYPRGKQQLPSRIYHAVPDMTRGQIQDVSKVIPESTAGREQSLAGVQIDRFEPLLPNIASEVQNPEHIVPDAWTRGGEDTRASMRTVAYITADGFRRESPGAPYTMQ